MGIQVSSFSTWIFALKKAYGFRLLALIVCGHHFLKGFVGGGGSSGLVGSGMEYHLRQHKVSGNSLQIYMSVATVPWAIKAIMGLWSDRFPLYGTYHKAPYVGVATVLATIAYFINGTMFFSVQTSVVCFFFMFFQMALVDLMVEAKYAEKVKVCPEKGPDLISFVWGGISIFHLCSTSVVGMLIERYGPDICFLFAIPFAVLIMIPVMRDYFEEGPEFQIQNEIERKNSTDVDMLQVVDDGHSPRKSETGSRSSTESNHSQVNLMSSEQKSAVMKCDLIEQDVMKKSLKTPKRKSDDSYGSSDTQVQDKQSALKSGQEEKQEPETILTPQELLQQPSNRPIFYMVLLMGFSGLFSAGFAVAVENILLNFLVAYVLGLSVLASFTIFLRPAIAKMNAFFFLQNVLSVSVQGAAFYFFTDTEEQYPEGPHFKPQFYLSSIGIVAAIFSLLGMTFYNMYAKEWNYRSILMVSSIIGACLQMLNCIVFARINVTHLGIDDKWFMVCSSAIQSAVFQFGWMPGTVMLAQMVPKGLESTMYALLAGSFNMSGGMSNYSGALLLQYLKCEPNGSNNETHQFDNLWKASAIGTLLPCITLCAIPYLIPNANQTEKLLLENAESPTVGSIYDRYIIRNRYGKLKDEKDQEASGSPMRSNPHGRQTTPSGNEIVSPTIGKPRIYE